MIEISGTMVVMAILSFALSVIGWSVRSRTQEIKELREKLAKTREEYVHKQDLDNIMSRVFDELKVISSKIDRKADK